MKRFTRIELFKENFKFSSGHFTIFSATERENLHGHNFNVYLAFDAEIKQNGIIFDYTVVKKYMESLCAGLNEYVLLPGRSKHIKIEQGQDYSYVHFNNEKIPFLPRDIKILPLENITIEELSSYFLNEFVQEFVKKNPHSISSAEVRVFLEPGESASAIWKNTP